jgi:hypothetical protein
MALIVENGTGLANAESYASVAYADAYFAARNVNNWDGNTASKEGYLRIATEYIEATYAELWKGYKRTREQALQFPRTSLELDGFFLDDNVIPKELMNACCELAHRAVHSTLLPDLTKSVKREKVDVIEVEYNTNSGDGVRYQQIDRMLSRYLVAGGMFRKVVRS